MTQRRVLTLALSVLTAGAMFTAAVPAVSAAAPARPTASASKKHAHSLTTTVTGTVNGVAQSGTLTINRFVRSGSSVLAVGDLALGGQNLGTVQAPVAVTDPPGSCQILHLDLGPLNLNLLGLQVHLNEVVLDITAQQGPGNLLGNLLCAVAHLLDNTNALGGIVAHLNQILGALNLNSLTTPVAGTVNGVAQTGTLTVDRFVRQANGILAVGDLVLGGLNLGTVQAPVAVTDPPDSCQILHLDLGPLDLNLLGLQVHLNEVVLDITAQQGPGNLLGNLLCAVAHLLDNTNTNALGAITALLNQILRALNL